jgi:hypothetical protein
VRFVFCGDADVGVDVYLDPQLDGAGPPPQRQRHPVPPPELLGHGLYGVGVYAAADLHVYLHTRRVWDADPRGGSSRLELADPHQCRRHS